MVSGRGAHDRAHDPPGLRDHQDRRRASRSSRASSSCASPTGSWSTATAPINPNPIAEQLADIAITSAETARAFGVEPRVAMLSYSTGESGTGADVEKVADATAARPRAATRPEGRGPDPVRRGGRRHRGEAQAARAARSPGTRPCSSSPTSTPGNNTYKAVQRSADAVAIGPVLQGLRKPVNDLCRGCTVTDIVNTVAITAIQAQGGD